MPSFFAASTTACHSELAADAEGLAAAGAEAGAAAAEGLAVAGAEAAAAAEAGFAAAAELAGAGLETAGLAAPPQALSSRPAVMIASRAEMRGNGVMAMLA